MPFSFERIKMSLLDTIKPLEFLNVDLAASSSSQLNVPDPRENIIDSKIDAITKILLEDDLTFNEMEQIIYAVRNDIGNFKVKQEESHDNG